eukprot:2228020-Prymnesium_polylepis.1
MVQPEKGWHRSPVSRGILAEPPMCRVTVRTVKHSTRRRRMMPRASPEPLVRCTRQGRATRAAGILMPLKVVTRCSSGETFHPRRIARLFPAGEPRTVP